MTVWLPELQRDCVINRIISMDEPKDLAVYYIKQTCSLIMNYYINSKYRYETSQKMPFIWILFYRMKLYNWECYQIQREYLEVTPGHELSVITNYCKSVMIMVLHFFATITRDWELLKISFVYDMNRIILELWVFYINSVLSG